MVRMEREYGQVSRLGVVAEEDADRLFRLFLTACMLGLDKGGKQGRLTRPWPFSGSLNLGCSVSAWMGRARETRDDRDKALSKTRGSGPSDSTWEPRNGKRHEYHDMPTRPLLLFLLFTALPHGR
jgi:hypothetical protein